MLSLYLYGAAGPEVVAGHEAAWRAWMDEHAAAGTTAAKTARGRRASQPDLIDPGDERTMCRSRACPAEVSRRAKRQTQRRKYGSHPA
jgi:hypothetical protein